MQIERGKPTTIDLYVKGATDAEKACGAAAAFAFFDAHRVSPWDAARAYFIREAQEKAATLGHSLEMTPREREWADVFDRSEQVALDACCAGWASIPAGAHFVLNGDVPEDYSGDPDA